MWRDTRGGKFFRDEKWPCCSGTFIQLTADYGTSAYVVNARNLYVNLYVPSTVSGVFGGESVKLTQATAYPLENTSRLTVSVKRPAVFGLQLRIPAWAGKATRVRVNGKTVKGVTAGRFLELRRSWRDDDVVEIVFDMGMRLEPLNAAHPEMVALMTGPLVLMPIGATAGLTRDDLLAAKRESADSWRLKDVTLKPFMAIGDETYRPYTQVTA